VILVNLIMLAIERTSWQYVHKKIHPLFLCISQLRWIGNIAIVLRTPSVTMAKAAISREHNSIVMVKWIIAVMCSGCACVFLGNPRICNNGSCHQMSESNVVVLMLQMMMHQRRYAICDS
jgi:hypothetical protein